jgi:c-di-GMP-binding flagellar brake protein YcgR
MTRAQDRRDSFRLHLDPGQATVKANQSLQIELRDLSASGGRLIVRAHGHELPELPPLEIEFADGDSLRARVDVVRIRSHEEGVFHLGARWSGLSPTCVDSLSRFITREYQRRTSDPARLLDQREALTVKSPMFIRNLLGGRPDDTPQTMSVIHRNLRLGAQLLVESVVFEEGRRVIRARFDKPAQLSSTLQYNFVLEGSGAVTVFESRCLDQRGLDVTLSLPREVRQTGSRESRRIDLSESASPPILVSFVQPRLGGAEVVGEVIDVAARGLSFRLPSRGHGLFPGDRIRGLSINVGARTIEARAAVRSVSQREEEDSAVCGVELLYFASSADQNVWQGFVFARMHPNIIDGNGRAESSWALLEASKYVALWTPPATRGLTRGEYLRAWQAPHSQVGHCLLLCQGGPDGRPVGMVAASLVYPRSWAFHQLARDATGDSPEGQAPLGQALELMSGILSRLKIATDFTYFLIYIEREKRFNERLYVDFAERYFDKDKLEITPMEVFRRATDQPLPERPHDGIEVVAANPDLLTEMAAFLADSTSQLARGALALNEEQIDLQDFTTKCARRDYERRREIYFALIDGRPCAALVAETGGEGVNIFGLVNSCRIFSLSDTGFDDGVQRALLHQAMAHYRDRGKRHFLYFGDSDRGPEVPIDLGFELISGGLQWIAHRDVIPAWVAYLEGIMAQTPAANGTTAGRDTVSITQVASEPGMNQ